jgi:hypothetical protein
MLSTLTAMSPAAPQLSPVFVEKWRDSFTELINQHWGELYSAFAQNNTCEADRIIEYFFDQKAQTCIKHPGRRFLFNCRITYFSDVYRYLAMQARLAKCCGVELQTLHPLTLAETAFPNCLEIAERRAPMPTSATSYCHMQRAEIQEWITDYWASLQSQDVWDHNHLQASSLALYHGIPVSVCDKCTGTPFGFDQAPYLDQSYSDRISVLVACRIHVASMMRLVS